MKQVKTWQTEATVRVLFQSVHSAKEPITPTRTTRHQFSAPGNSDTSELEAVPEPEHGDGSDRDVRLPHTGIYAIRSRSNFSTVFISNEIEENDIFGTEYAVRDESSFLFTKSSEGALTSCKKSNIFCEIDKGAVRLFDNRLQLAEETFCKILSNCRSELQTQKWKQI